MFEWLRRQREQGELDGRTRHYVFAEESRLIRVALSTIGVDVQCLEKEPLVAESAAKIAGYFRARSVRSLSRAKLGQTGARPSRPRGLSRSSHRQILCSHRYK